MKYFELSIMMYLMQDIHYKDCNEELARFLNYSMGKSNLLSKLHNKKGFKHYSFCTLYPTEKDGIYKADEIYSFKLRSYNKDYITAFKECLNGLSNDEFAVTGIIIKEFEHKPIDYCDNITPCITTISENYDDKTIVRSFFVGKDDPKILKQNIFNNIIKKYNDFYKTNININYDDVIEDILIKNKCPIVINYKNIKLMGNKIRIKFKQNGFAQEIANFIVVESVGERNSSLGAGFVKPYFVKR